MFFKTFFYFCSSDSKNESIKKKMKIRKQILEKVADSYGCRKQLMTALGVSAPTMSRYIQDNDDNLTKAASLKVIGEYFNLPAEEILEEENKAA